MAPETVRERGQMSEVELEFVKRLSLFAGLTEEVLLRLIREGQRIEIAEPRPVFREGEPAKDLVIVLSGRIEIWKNAADGSEQRIAALGPGNVAGEMSLLDIQPRSAEVRATAGSTLLIIPHGSLGAVYHDSPTSYTLLVMNLAREISLRLRRMDIAMANIMAELSSVSRITDHRGDDLA